MSQTPSNGPADMAQPSSSSGENPPALQPDNSNQFREIIHSIHPEKLRFITADRWKIYMTILWALLERRRVHEVEVYYDDLMTDALQLAPIFEPGTYDPDIFRGDIKSLEGWGNIAPLRLEARRIESMADRKLQKFLCRLDDETAAFLEYSESRSIAGTEIIADRGRHFLRDAAERMEEARRKASKLTKAMKKDEEDNARSEELLRIIYLLIEADQKIDAAAKELAAFDAALINFTINPFRLESLSNVIDQLEKYIEDYVMAATKQGIELQKSAQRLQKENILKILLEAHDAAIVRLRLDPLMGMTPAHIRHPKDVLSSIIQFFQPSGRFEILLERVHSAARDVVRQVHAHLENVRARNLRIETLRDRTREMAKLDENNIQVANIWINQLFTSAHIVTDLRMGTPESKSFPPRPTRRYEATRGIHHGGYLTTKQSLPEEEKALIKARFLDINRFVLDKILKGQPKSQLYDAILTSEEDFHNLLLAIKFYKFTSDHQRQNLRYKINHSVHKQRARFICDNGSLDATDSQFIISTGVMKYD